MTNDYHLSHQVQDRATELQIWASDNDESLSLFEALQIATQIQRNRILEQAYMVGGSTPGALEAIAMELGAAKEGTTIKSVLEDISMKD